MIILSTLKVVNATVESELPFNFKLFHDEDNNLLIDVYISTLNHTITFHESGFYGLYNLCKDKKDHNYDTLSITFGKEVNFKLLIFRNINIDHGDLMFTLLEVIDAIKLCSFDVEKKNYKGKVIYH